MHRRNLGGKAEQGNRHRQLSAAAMPWRLVGVTFITLLALMTFARPGSSRPVDRGARYFARADTDTVRSGTGVPGNTGVVSALLDSTSVARPDSSAVNRSDTSATRPDTSATRPDTSTAQQAPPADTTATGGALLPSAPDTLGLVSDTLAAFPDTSLVDKYFGRRGADSRTASVFPRTERPFLPGPGVYWKHELKLDSTGRYFVAREFVSKGEVRYPTVLSYDEYTEARLNYDVSKNWRTLSDQAASIRRSQRGGGVGVDIVIPGGRESAFSQIFGRPGVSLKVTGQANITAGFDYRKSDQQASVLVSPSRIDPNFKQDLSLGITGSIGDKLNVDVNWDTENQFEYQNKLKLNFQGYDDDIVKRVEAGNVFLESPSQLIRGGQSLFGIKTVFKVGGLDVTAIASQQEGEGNSLNINGGSEETEFDLEPTEYDKSTHFFLGYYFRNRFEDAMRDPPNIRLDNNFQGISEIEVWKMKAISAEDRDVRNAVAIVDLAEDQAITVRANEYTDEIPPNAEIDQYSDAELDQRVVLDNNTNGYLTDEKGLDPSDFQVGRWRRLTENEYRIDKQLGYISLNERLQEHEALGVAYRYVSGGQVIKVGTLSTETGGSEGGQNGERLVLKLLRPGTPKPPDLTSVEKFNPAYWYLELRNIYRLNSSGLSSSNFNLNIFYQAPGKTPSPRLPNVGGQAQLLELLGLDRLTSDGQRQPDNRFDFLPEYTISQTKGLLIFPYLEPFGSRIDAVVDSLAEGNQSLKNLLTYRRLYTEEEETASRDAAHSDLYVIRGSFTGAVRDYYDLNAAAGVIPGSVKVTSGGSPLAEGADFTVDYQGGTVQIINPAYTAPGRNINITFEQNQFLNLQKKTQVGIMAQYNFGTSLKLAATMLNLSQKSPVDKFRLGEEPVSNTIWGLYGKLDVQPRWLTRAVDALPLIQTKEESSVLITGELAQLRPSHAQTFAFEQARRTLQDSGRDMTSDELRGVSYLDDFEGFEHTFSLRTPGAWLLSAAPDSISIDDIDGRSDLEKSRWRGMFAWYTLTNAVFGDRNLVQTLATRPVDLVDVYPTKQTVAGSDNRISTFDFYLNPFKRGPYNQNSTLDSLRLHPERVWGGVTQRLPAGYNNFNAKNIEFVEFIFKPFVNDDPNGDAGPDARLFVDLGNISEDVIPNQAFNSEDGLSTSTLDDDALDGLRLSRLPTLSPSNSLNIDSKTNRTEDLGLDGLASYDPDGYTSDLASAAEQVVFRDWLDNLVGSDDAVTRSEIEKARIDPSGDDFHHFTENEYFNDERFWPGDLYPNGAPIQERFSQFFPASELNGFESQNRFRSSGRGNSRYPDSEDLNQNGFVDTDNAYFQYEVPLSTSIADEQANPESTSDYVVNKIVNEEGDFWYQVRIPIRRWTRKVGSIGENFDKINAIRIWTTGHRAPITVRFASFELVGSQWIKSENVLEETDTLGVDLTSRLTLSSINNEENGNLYSPPLGSVISQNKLATGQFQAVREQSMALEVTDLGPGRQQGIYRTYRTGWDLLKYESLRMFVHMHGKLADGRDLVELAREDKSAARSKLKLFVRLGSNESRDYYEYEQPLTPGAFPQSAATNRTTAEVDELWQTFSSLGGESQDLNSMTLRLSALNLLKMTRDRFTLQNGQFYPTDSLFWNVDENGIKVDPSVPDAELFAPPGTRLGIMGNPSLSRVNTIVIGVRNPSRQDGAEHIIETAEVWLNELRVSGYDEASGWAGLLNTDIRLADLGVIRASLQSQQDGFGDLASTLGERDQASLMDWDVTANLNMDKFIPEKFGWNLPVSFQMQSKTSTPRYSPSGDVRIQDQLDLIDQRTDLNPEERASERLNIIQSAQSYSFQRSFSAEVSKSGSNSTFLRNTLDGLNVRYSYADSDGRSPSQRLNDSWRWSGSVSYRYAGKAKTLKPFWFMDSLPVVGAIADLRFNYAPQAVTAVGTAARSFSVSQERARFQRLEEGEIALPDLVDNPLREQQQFSHDRNFSYQYNPFSFLMLGLDTRTDQSLNSVAADTMFTLFRWDSTATQFESFPDLDFNAALEQGLITADDIQKGRAFETTRLNVLPTGQVVNRIFSGRYSPRTDSYNQVFRATFQPRFATGGWLNWFQLQPITYVSNYQWQNGAIGRNTGAFISNQTDIRASFSLRPLDFWRKFDFYRTLETNARRQEQAVLARRQAERDFKTRTEAMLDLREERLKALILKGMPEDSARIKIEAENPLPQRRDTTSSGFRLPSANSLLRSLVFAATGISDLNFSYSNQRRSRLTNVGRIDDEGDVRVNYTFFDAFRGFGPPVGYRFGFHRTIDPTQRILNSNVQVSDDFDWSDRIQTRATFQPHKLVQLTLNWNNDWTRREEAYFEPTIEDPYNRVAMESGNTKASVWGFGASFRKMFESQYNTFLADYERYTDRSVPMTDENGDGRVVLTNKSVTEDFRKAILSGGSGSGLMPFPMPTWNLSYSGLGQWPILRNVFQSAVLRHGYTADYSTDFKTDVAGRTGTAFADFNFAGEKVRYLLPDQQVSSVRVNERFTPLIGVDLTWKGRLSTNLAWNKSNSYSLMTTSFDMDEMRTNEISMSATWQQQGLKLPFIKMKPLQNRISFTLTAALSNNESYRLFTKEALTDAVQGYKTQGAAYNPFDAITGDTRALNDGTRRITLLPKLAYQFSNRVTADFSMKYERLISNNDRNPDFTSLTGNFNIRVSFSN